MIGSMFIPGTLHGIEASFLADASPSCTLPFFLGCLVLSSASCLPGEVPRVHRLLDCVAEGCPGHGLCICLLRVLLRLGFSGISVSLGGSGLDCLY